MGGETAPTSSDLAAMDLAAICRRCREETARYRSGEPHDDRFCFQIFRRAVVEGDGGCWQELHSIYRDQLLSWCRRAVTDPSADLEELASVSWEKFWHNFTADKLARSNGTPAVLLYLKMCARSAAADLSRSRPPAQSLDEKEFQRPDSQPTPGDALAAQDAKARFWQILNASLRDDTERVLMHLTYEMELKSAEIQAQRPDLFPSVHDVYRVTRNVLDRLKRNRELRAWFENEGS